MKRAPAVAAILCTLAIAGGPAGPVRAADQRYLVSGRDSFVIGNGDIQSEVNYRGSQGLTVTRRGPTPLYVAKVSYVRDDQGAASPATAAYVVDFSASGDQIAWGAPEPPSLTGLHQPFAT